MKSQSFSKPTLVYSSGRIRQTADDAQMVARALGELVAMAERGELVAVAFVARTSKGQIVHGFNGLFERDIPEAHWATCRLADQLLYPEG